MTDRNRIAPSHKSASSSASDRNSALFVKERKAREAVNLARTLELKSLRLAKEATERDAASHAASLAPVKKTNVRRPLADMAVAPEAEE